MGTLDRLPASNTPCIHDIINGDSRKHAFLLYKQASQGEGGVAFQEQAPSMQITREDHERSTKCRTLVLHSRIVSGVVDGDSCDGDRVEATAV